MCTVTFVRSGSKAIITSNRDEHVERPALEPLPYNINGRKIYFPKDIKAGGTWYAVNDGGDVLVLLNGAREKHEFRSDYRKSRGLVVLDIISSHSPILSWNETDLDNIEPFTLVLFENEKLFQLQWDGKNKDKLSLDPLKNYIWSSATLYPREIREQRSGWFSDFMDGKSAPAPEDMMRFHRYTKTDDPESGLVINRFDFLKTLSITQTMIDGADIGICHRDLVTGLDFRQSFTKE